MVQEEVIIEFSSNTQKAENSGDRLIEVFEEMSATNDKLLETFKNINSTVSESANKFNNLSNNANKSTKSWAMSFAKLTSFATVAFKKISDWTAESAEFVGTQTRFNAVFDKTNGELQEATKWVNEYSEALFLDNKQVMNAVSTFRILTRNMGINNEQSKKMSQNLTQIAYDLAAVKNVDVSEAMTALTSGLGGEAEAMKKYGVYLNQATLQATLYAEGIDRTVASLNAAERAQLIYYQIMKTTAGQQGYLAKTLLSPANALNIIKTQFTLLAREIGNVFIPILTALVPIVILVTRALRNLAVALANLLGINIDFDAYSEDIGNISTGIDGIGDSASGASKKIKNMLRDFDELHVVNFDEPTGSGSGIGAGGGSLDLPDLDYAGYAGNLDAINEKLKQAEGIIKLIGAGIAGWAIGKAVSKFLELFGIIDKTHGLLITLGTTIAGISLQLNLNLLEDIKTNGLDGKKMLGLIMSALGTGLGAGLVAIGLGATGGIALTIGTAVTLGVLFYDFAQIAEPSALAKKWAKEEERLKKELGWYNENNKWYNYVEIWFKLKIRFAWDNIFTKGLNKIAEHNGNYMGDRTAQEYQKAWQNSDVSGGILTDYWIKTKTETENGIIDVSNVINNGNIASAWATQLGTMETNTDTTFTGISSVTSSRFSEAERSITDNMTTANNNITTLFGEMNNTVVTNTDDILVKGSNSFTNLKDNIDSSMTDAEKTVKDNADLMSSSAKDMADKIDKYSTNSKNSLESISKIKLKLPHFKVDWDGNGFAGQLLQKIGFPGFPLIGVDWYMNGGFPTKGDLFIANEREPELIGSMGNRSVVANNTQITEGIADASYYGMRKALKEVDFGGDTEIYIGNRQITDYVVKQKKMDDRRYGR